jgi:hypothetical protein
MSALGRVRPPWGTFTNEAEMFAKGHKRTLERGSGMSASPPEWTCSASASMSARCQEQKSRLASESRRRSAHQAVSDHRIHLRRLVRLRRTQPQTLIGVSYPMGAEPLWLAHAQGCRVFSSRSRAESRPHPHSRADRRRTHHPEVDSRHSVERRIAIGGRVSVRRHIVATRRRVVDIGCRIAVAPVMATPIADVFERRGLEV